MRRYTTRDAAELLEISPAQIRGLVRAALISPAHGPRGAFRFSFQDIIIMRTAKELMAARISAQKVHSALQRLNGQLPKGRSLTAVRIAAEGNRIVVRDAGTVWSVESGQIQFDFTVSEMASRLAPVARRVAAEAHASPDQLSRRRLVSPRPRTRAGRGTGRTQRLSQGDRSGCRARRSAHQPRSAAARAREPEGSRSALPNRG